MPIEVLATDKAFASSPDAGDPTCICSRCESAIGENEVPVRCFTTNEHGDVNYSSLEYRYCTPCLALMGVENAFAEECCLVD
jgi:hypothetical protein